MKQIKSTLKLSAIGLAALGLAACDTGAPANTGDSKAETAVAAADQVSRPKYPFSTDEMYDPATVAGYTGTHQEIYDRIDASLDDHVANLQRWMRQPSVSAQNIGVIDMANMLRDDLENMGFQEAELVPTDGHPGVWGYYDAGAEKTLLIYMMYDVQPVNEEDWQSPPFEANIIDHELGKVMMARGAVNQKGPQRAFLNALQSIIDVNGTLPVNLMIAAEGEEELGSPHYPQIVDKYEERMKTADGVLFPMTSQGPDGKSNMLLGVKGILYFEIEAKGGDWGGPSVAEIHGSNKGIVDSPTLRLIQAIASMTSEDGNTILIPGYYDNIIPPSEEEQLLINKTIETRDDAAIQKVLGVSRWIDDQTGREALVDLLYNPTLNVDGLWSGYTGEGTKTILPHIATAKVDSRLPLGQDPADMLAKIRAHLDANGYQDIELRQMSGYPAAQTSAFADISQTVISVYNKYTEGLSINPRIAGSAPFYQFTDRLKLPLIPAGLGHGRGAHAPNEFLLIEPAEGVKVAGLAEIEKAYVDMLFSLATAAPKDAN
ncbi:peptidase M20 [Kordiimonas sediminis]|uniref:Peptidase M20 n=1 Tax=Kordiimonas sediminis TaxID=1735581 RepID=A0A919ASA2_9PROT|nr:M20/M25/M40 family metallo-hydrolase [Kordiimonas sediminis]GHF19585.1 peptidase M20 [Kordiimonas sediminis]